MKNAAAAALGKGALGAYHRRRLVLAVLAVSAWTSARSFCLPLARLFLSNVQVTRVADVTMVGDRVAADDQAPNGLCV